MKKRPESTAIFSPLGEIEGSASVAITLRRDELSVGELDQPDTGESDIVRADLPDAATDTDTATKPAALVGLPTAPLTIDSNVELDLPEHGISGIFTVTPSCCARHRIPVRCAVTARPQQNAGILDLRVEG